MTSPKRAIVLAGGGPAVGLSIGALKRLDAEPDIRFDVWSCACIGAWVGTLWNQASAGSECDAVDDFFQRVFRPDQDYARFPMASIFAPNWGDYAAGVAKFFANPESYRDLFAPDMIGRAFFDHAHFVMTPGRWSEGDVNSAIFNNLIAPNPAARLLTSLIYLSPLKGLAQIYYPNRAFLNAIDFTALYADDKPTLYVNAFDAQSGEAVLFSNKADRYGDIDAQTLCASSALPYLIAPVETQDATYCEGATVNTVSFAHLLDDHPDLDEIWISRLLDLGQVRPPENLVDALNNLVMLFAAASSQKDVALFEADVALAKAAGKVKSTLRIVDIPVSPRVGYDWSFGNLAAGAAEGYAACDAAVAAYRAQPPMRLAA